MRLKAALALLGVVGVLAATALQFLAWVPDDEMAPSLYAGDLVLIWPRPAQPGEVVALTDPIDPSRWTLRRVLAVTGSARYEDGFYHTDGEEPEVLDMGSIGDRRVLREGHWLTLRQSRPIRWEMAPVAIPTDRVWLAADDRDGALDSRWWGPAPTAAVQGTVILRIGAPHHAWRGWITTRP